MAKKTKKLATPTGKNIDELRAELVTTQTDLVEARRSHASKELVNTRRLRELKQQVARINTELTKQVKDEQSKEEKE